MLKTRPKLSEWPAIVFLVFLFSIIGAIPILLAINYWYLKTPSIDPPIFLRICTLIPGFLFGFWFAQKQINKEYWCLTETELICGIGLRQKVFLLSSIEKIIINIPIDGSMLLLFKDGSRLPFRLRAIPGGSEIMVELVRKLNERVIQDYKFSSEEIRKLCLADINELIPARR